jgi:ribulose-bisphosphate carboxylase large chain
MDPQLACPILFHPALLGSFVTIHTRAWRWGGLVGCWAGWPGADVTIFPNFGGRFSCSREDCLAIAEAAQAAAGTSY